MTMMMIKVKRSKVRVRGGGHTVSAEPGSRTACYICFYTDAHLYN